jgi:LysM repeat protein
LSLRSPTIHPPTDSNTITDNPILAMKPTTPRRTRRLLARAATMNHDAEEFDDYGPEPNMKLSHAFLVVLALHVVAVGGLYAFNTIKAGNHATAKAESKAATVAAKAISSEEKGNSGSGGSGNQGNDRPPLESKPAPVAKVSKTSGNTESSDQATQPSKGFLNMLKKAGIGGGTVAGSAKLAAQEPAAPAGVPQTYTVKSGDTITKIASSLRVTIPDLEKVNGLAGNAVLQVGQILKVPAQAIAQAASAVQTEAGKVAASTAKLPSDAVAAVTQTPSNAVPESVTTSEETTGVSQYTVVKGDSPYKIAKKFKITPDELMKANGITDPKKIQIGQELKIPAPIGKAKTAK